jgi:hypothetical protein
MTIPDIRIAAPADPAGAVFDKHGTPFLVFGRHPEHGEGWTLHYLDGNGDPDQHFIRGEIVDGGWALSQASEWLMREAGA